MKKKKKMGKGRWFDIFMGIVIQCICMFPWIDTANGKFNTITYFVRIQKATKAGDIFSEDLEKYLYQLADIFNYGQRAFMFQCLLVFMLVMQLTALIVMLISFRKKVTRKITIFSAMAGVAVWVTWVNAGVGVSGIIYYYVAVLSFAEIVWLFGSLMLEQWDEATRKEKERQVREKELRKERKERLKFPGRYSELFFQILRKNFLYNRSDYLILIISEAAVAGSLVLGFGIRKMFLESYRGGFELAALGIGAILRQFIVIIGVISTFLLVIIMTTYLKRRMSEYGVFQTLGMRKTTLNRVGTVELIICYLIASGIGILIGRICCTLFRVIIKYKFPELEVSGVLGITVNIYAMGTMLAIYLLALALAYEVYIEADITDIRNVVLKKEKIPEKCTILSIMAGSVIIIFSIYRFTKIGTAESIWMLVIFFAGMYIALKGCWSIYLKCQRKNRKKYLKNLLQNQMVIHRFQTTVKYVSVMTIISVCALFYFSLQAISNYIAEKPDSLFPYDYICMATEEDEMLFQQIEQECDGTIITIPMVRATTVDNTEKPEDYRTVIIPQGQNIGISETSYWKLKKLAGEKADGMLNLDREGQKIWIVHQQDKAVKSQPIDWYYGRETPSIYIGQPLRYYNFLQRDDIFVPREIAGEERNALTGCVRQGKYENLIVFSDEYFEQVKESWKTTNALTGNPLSEEEKVPDVTIHKWANQLKLIRIPKKARERTDEILSEFAENHKYDEQMDSLVKSYYAKTDMIRQRKMERLMEFIMNLTVVGLLLLSGIFLMHMKIKEELPEMKERYLFMNRFGMHDEERRRFIKHEVRLSVKAASVLSAVVIPVFTFVVLKLRGFTIADTENYLKLELVIIVVWSLVWLMDLEYLQCLVIRKVETQNEK